MLLHEDARLCTLIWYVLLVSDRPRLCPQVSQTRREALCTSFAQSPLKQAVDRHLLTFLGYNSYHLPMYAKPHMV